MAQLEGGAAAKVQTAAVNTAPEPVAAAPAEPVVESAPAEKPAPVAAAPKPAAAPVSQVV